jgi:hypothetical protein
MSGPRTVKTPQLEVTEWVVMMRGCAHSKAWALNRDFILLSEGSHAPRLSIRRAACVDRADQQHSVLDLSRARGRQPNGQTWNGSTAQKENLMTQSTRYCQFRRFLAPALIIWAGCFGTSASASAQTTILDFEDLSPTGGFFQPMPSGYGGINWSDVFWPYDAPQDPFNAKSGIVRIASNRTPRPDDPIPRGQFQFVIPDQVFNGAWFAGPNPPQVVEVQFLLYNDGALVHSSAILQVSPVPTFLASGYTGPVDAVTILGDEGEFVFDDLSYSTTSPDKSKCSHVAGTFVFSSFTFTSPTTATAEASVTGDLAGTAHAEYFNIEQSGNGAVHMDGVHIITTTGGTLVTSDRILLLPDRDPGWGRANSQLRIVAGTGVNANASGLLHTHGRVNFGTLEGSIDFNGIVCRP